ncbi:unnamed protein product, partial [Vitis vinifera]|uniref:Uncharacterized protein n=1 Tax=Vitis vinifera TaxID=29760 RepID=D7SYT5_VITVI
MCSNCLIILNETKCPHFLQFHCVGYPSRRIPSENPPHCPWGCFQHLILMISQLWKKTPCPFLPTQ